MSYSDLRRVQSPEFCMGNWPLNGHALDVSGHGNHGTASNVTYTAGPHGRQVGVFNATTSKIIVTSSTAIDLAGLTAVSASAWVYASGAGENNSGRVLEKLHSVGVAYQGAATPYIYYTYVATTGGAESAYQDNRIVQGRWRHLAISWQAATGTIATYLDSALIAIGATVSAYPIDDDSGNDLCIGNRASDTARTWNGNLADVRIYNCALTGDEIRQLYLSQLGGVLL